MSGIFDIIKLLLICGTVLCLAFTILLAMPQSQLRAFLLPIVGWGIAALSAAYCIMPFDLAPEAFFGPFGLVDDAAALVTGVVAARTAMKAKES